MSIYFFTNDNRRSVQYGCDLPTGGYYYNEFCREDESDSEELFDYADGLTFTEFEKDLINKYNFRIPVTLYSKLVSDFIISPQPTLLQHNIVYMFGKNLEKMLERTRHDLEIRFPLETRGEL